jgi:chromosomal replication initiation ATPase DnaA
VVQYLSAENFADLVHQAGRAATLEELRSSYLEIDVLLLDDLDAIENDDQAEEESRLRCW